ncbi:MAG: hypothetical protein LBL43_02585 [Treponema sp.]|nr:hypothetical protein [Treponema sp.]
MDGLRSAEGRFLRAGVCFFLTLFLALVPPVHGEETPSPTTVPGEYAEETPPAGEAPLLDVGTLKNRIEDEASSELVSLNLGNSEVSLLISGFWKGSFSVNWGLNFTPLGTTFGAGNDPLVLFTQETDLTLSLWVRERWFLEAGFLDDYALNTYRGGYQGMGSEPIQYLGVGNTGLDFPRFPYLDLGGDSPSSFGAYGRFGTGDFTFHTLVRYDGAAREERTFVGNRERTYSYGDLAYPLRGVSFVLPDEGLDTIPEVFLEDETGGIRDSLGRRWRRAGTSEYSASGRYGLVELSSPPEGMVAVAYSKRGSRKPWESSLGNYDDPLSGSGDFLAQVKDWFGGKDLKAWPQSGDSSGAGRPATGRPGAASFPQLGVEALVVYERGTFSPFERRNRYRSPTNSAVSASLVQLSTGESVSGYETLPLEDIQVSTNLPLYVPDSQSAGSQRGVYELIRGRNSITRRDPVERWPLAPENGDLYLPGVKEFTGDLGLRFTNYGGAGAFSIGTDVVPGSVEVFRGGIQDPGFSFNAQSGAVSLENPPGISEIIRITYLKRSDETRLGSLAAGLGAVYESGGPFSAKLGLGLRWNIKAESFSEEGASSPGTVGLGAEARWDTENLKTSLTFGLGFEQPDTTGLYRVTGMEGNEITLSLPGSSFLSEIPGLPPPASHPVSLYRRENRADLKYRNYLNSTALGTTLMGVSWNAPLVSGRSGPYPAMDGGFTGGTQVQVLIAEFDFTQEKSWTGFQTPLGQEGELLERAEEIEIPLGLYDISNNLNNILILVQFGNMTEENGGYEENGSLIIEKQIFPNPPDPNVRLDRIDDSHYLASLRLSDEERRRLRDARFMRVLVTGNGGAVSGKIGIAPPIVKGTGWRPLIVEGGTVKTAEERPAAGVRAVETFDTASPSLSETYGDLIRRLHQDTGARQTQRILEISWDDPAAKEALGADTRTAPIPLSRYRRLAFFVRGPESGDQGKLDGGRLRFVIGRGPSSLNRGGETALEVFIPLRTNGAGTFSPGKWSGVEVHYREGDQRILVDGTAVPGSSVVYRAGVMSDSGGRYAVSGTEEAGKSAWIGVFLEGVPVLPVTGRFALDEILLEDSSPAYRINGGVQSEWRRPGTLAEINGRDLVSDLVLSGAVETGAEGDPFSGDGDGYFAVNGRTAGEITMLGVRVSGNFSLSANNGGDYAWTGGHGLSRSWGPFSAGETFALAPDDETMNHRVNLALSGPFRSSLSGELLLQDEKFKRQWRAGVGANLAKRIPLDLSLEAGAVWTENTSQSPGENYGESWAESWIDLVPDAGYGASRRDTDLVFTASLGTSPLGMVFSLRGGTGFSRTNRATQSSTLARLEFPYAPGVYRMVFRGEREFRRDLYYEGQSFKDDASQYGKSLEDSLPLWYSIPFYSLFSRDQEKRMADSAASSLSQGYSQFTDKFEYSLDLPERFDRYAFILPRRVGFNIGRVLEQRLETPLDTLNLGASLSFSSLNVFGAFGAVPLFKFYQGDELAHSLEASVALPRGEEASFRFQAVQNLGFYGFREEELRLDNSLTLTTPGGSKRGGNWLENLNLEWTTPSPKSVLGLLYGKVMDRIRTQSSWLTLAGIAESEYEQLRKLTMEFIFEHTKGTSSATGPYNKTYSPDSTRFSLILGYESIIRIFGRLNFSVFAKLEGSQNFQTRILSLTGVLGTTLQVTF